MSFEVLTKMGGTFENCWTDDNVPVTFETLAEALRALAVHIGNIRDAVDDGNMEAGWQVSDFCIRDASNDGYLDVAYAIRHIGAKIRTEDGYAFEVLEDGSLTDGDLSYDSLDNLGCRWLVI